MMLKALLLVGGPMSKRHYVGILYPLYKTEGIASIQLYVIVLIMSSDCMVYNVSQFLTNFIKVTIIFQPLRL